MSYATIDETFWTDPKVRRLSPGEKLVFFHLITRPGRHFSGIYFLDRESLPGFTGLTEKEATKCFDTLLIPYAMIAYDKEYSIVWVKAMLKRQTRGKISPQQLRGIANHLDTLHNCPLIKDFMEYYNTLSIPYVWKADTLSLQVEVEVDRAIEREITPPTPPRGNGISANSLATLWNEQAPQELPRVNLPFSRPPADLKKINAVIHRHPQQEWWKALLKKVSTIPGLLGKNDRGWMASFDFAVLKAEKILDGKYDTWGKEADPWSKMTL